MMCLDKSATGDTPITSPSLILRQMAPSPELPDSSSVKVIRASLVDLMAEQKLLSSQNPSSKRSSRRPDVGVGSVFLNFPWEQVRICVEYLE